MDERDKSKGDGRRWTVDRKGRSRGDDGRRDPGAACTFDMLTTISRCINITFRMEPCA
jgi:hypothetical protein